MSKPTFQFFSFLGALAKVGEKKLSFVMSVRPTTWNNLAPIGGIFMKFDMYFSKICRENSSIINP